MTNKINDIILLLAAVVFSGIVAFILKRLFYKNKRPNGKKGGLISIHVVLAVAILVSYAIITMDVFSSLLLLFLVYLIAKGRSDEGQHSLQQIIFSILIGSGLPVWVIFMYKKYNGNLLFRATEEREDFSGKPKRARDERYQADDEPELRIHNLPDI